MTSPHRHAPYHYIAGKAANLALAPVAVILLPGMIGEEGYGNYSYWFGLISIYIVLLDFGCQPVLRRFLPEIVDHHPQQSASLFHRCLTIKLIPLTLLILGSLLLASDKTTAIALIAAAAAAAIATNFADVYYAYQRMGTHSAVLLGRKTCRLILVPLFFFLWEIPGIFIALVITEFLALLISAPATKLFSGKRHPLTKPFRHYHYHGFIVFIAFLFATLAGRMPVISAGWLSLDMDTIGRLALCIDLSFFALKELINSVSESIFPRLISYKSASQTSKYQQLVQLNYRVVNFVTLAALALSQGLISSFLPLLGSGFYKAETELRILLPFILLACWTCIHNQHMLIHNRSHQLAINQVCGFAAGSIYVAYAYSNTQITITHLVYALCIAITTSCIISYLSYREGPFSWQTFSNFVRLLPATIITATVLYQWNPNNILDIVLATLVGGILFLAVNLMTKGVSTQDLQWLRNSLRKDSS